jgi:hypothetical protein
MKRFLHLWTGGCLALLSVCSLTAQTTFKDPVGVVEQWSDASTSPKVIDLNFSDTSWPNTWGDAGTAIQCPEYSSGIYVNATLNTPVLGSDAVSYPVLFHNCAFATTQSYSGYAASTSAFARQYYENQSVCKNNDWKQSGHTYYLEDNITYDANGRPTKGEAGFVQMCRNAATDGATSLHGWMEIDHLPYVERIQWSWSSTSWGRGIKCDIKVGEEDWKPLVWMGSERQKNGYTVFSDQGYFMEDVIDQHDVSLRWRIWDGDANFGDEAQVQITESGVNWQAIDPLAQRQATRVHKVQIFGDPISAEQAAYARTHPVGEIGTPSDLSQFDYTADTDTVPTQEEEEARILAFPTAEGFGKYATGGRGGRVVHVTKLTDDGSEGTLRWAFTQYKEEPITILFDVSGQIALASELRVNRNNWTMAGQSAPGEGIAITRNKMNLGGSQNFIVRNVRFRIGQRDLAGNIQAENALGAENCANFIFDHCSFGWSVEENMNTADSHFLTVQYSIIHEGLYDAGHVKGVRGYGCQWGGSPATYHHNLLAHNNSRSARLNGARGEDYVVFMEYANNVNYNYGSRGGCYGGENTAEISAYNGLNSAHECNFMNNYYKPGPNSNTSSVTFVNASYARDGATSWAPSQWYIDGNVAEGFANATKDNWSAVEVEHYTLNDIRVDERIVTKTPWYKYALVNPVGSYDPTEYMLTNLETATEAYQSVLAKAGTIQRDVVERRVVQDVTSGKPQYIGTKAAGIIDKETDAEGFYEYDSNYTLPIDSDGDGMPDDWEISHQLDPQVADNNRLNSDGYTALEVYLNALMGEEQKCDFSTNALEATTLRMQASYDSLHKVLHIGEEAIGGRLEVYNTGGQLLSVRHLRSTETSLADLPVGFYLLRISGREITPFVLKVSR